METLLAVSDLYSTNVIVFEENGPCKKRKLTRRNHNRSVAVSYRTGLNNKGERDYNHYDSVCDINAADLHVAARYVAK